MQWNEIAHFCECRAIELFAIFSLYFFFLFLCRKRQKGHTLIYIVHSLTCLFTLFPLMSIFFLLLAVFHKHHHYRWSIFPIIILHTLAYHINYETNGGMSEWVRERKKWNSKCHFYSRCRTSVSELRNSRKKGQMVRTKTLFFPRKLWLISSSRKVANNSIFFFWSPDWLTGMTTTTTREHEHIYMLVHTLKIR